MVTPPGGNEAVMGLFIKTRRSWLLSRKQEWDGGGIHIEKRAMHHSAISGDTLILRNHLLISGTKNTFSGQGAVIALFVYVILKELSVHIIGSQRYSHTSSPFHERCRITTLQSLKSCVNEFVYYFCSIHSSLRLKISC